jgi:hypothetical protein
MNGNLCAPFVLRSEPRGGAGRKQAILYRQNEMPETQCSLFPIDCTNPKLDVAGSTPVSRSIFSIARSLCAPFTSAAD